MHHTLVYNAPAAGVNAVNTDMAAAVEADFSQRSSHYIFTENYRLWGAALVGTSVIRGRFQVPTWNAIGEFALTQANRSLQPPANPQWDLWESLPPPIPINEEFQVQVSNNLGAATEIENAVINIIPDGWNKNLPTGQLSFAARATVAITPTLNAWSGPNALTFSQALRGGVYAVCGCVVQGTNAAAFRLIFPRANLYQGRKLRPGGMIQNAVGDAINQQVHPWGLHMGEWGRFHTFEPVQIEVFGTVAGAITYQVFLFLVYLGTDLSALGVSGVRSI